MSDIAYTPTTLETGVSLLPRANLKRHLIAAMLSAVVPGAGQFFLGKRRKAILLIVVFVVASMGFWPLRLPRSYLGLMSLGWVLLLLSLFAFYDALLGRDATPSTRLSKWWIFVGIPLHYIGFNLIFTLLFFGSGFHTARVAGSSMEPTLLANERFVYDKAYRSQPMGRGDLVILQRRNSLLIKRVVAIGGDTIEGNQQQILLNGQPASEPFVQHKSPVGNDPTLDTFGPVTIPAGKYFVMGDNPDVSLDSRTPSFGLVDANEIVGKAIYSYRFNGSPFSQKLN